MSMEKYDKTLHLFTEGTRPDGPVDQAWLEDWKKATQVIGPNDPEVDAITGALKPGAGHVREVCMPSIEWLDVCMTCSSLGRLLATWTIVFNRTKRIPSPLNPNQWKSAEGLG